MLRIVFLSFFILINSISVFGEIFPVEFIKIMDKVWIHKSYEIVAGYKTPSNGLIIETVHGVVLIDTAWNDEETSQILTFVKNEIHKSVQACFITHFHQDRAGGLKIVSSRNIPIYMTNLTYELLGKPRLKKSFISISNETVSIDNVSLTIGYFGPAHSRDNITIWILSKELLFGGCLIKSLDSKNLGNIEDADLMNWPNVLREILSNYKEVKVVIPGHGEYGDISLVKHTLELFI